MSRWLIVWVVLLAVVTGVVVVFLVIITNSLASINGSLAVADAAVTDIDGDTKTLPNQVETVNGSLTAIDQALDQIPGQADVVIGALGSIEGKLKTTDGSLKDTDSVLKVVLGQVGDVRTVLVDADDPPDKFGVQNIHRRVALANGTGNTGEMGTNPGSLTAAKGDTANIIGSLQDTNKHLTSICGFVNLVQPQPC